MSTGRLFSLNEPVELHLLYYLFVGCRWVFRRLDRVLQRDPLRMKPLVRLLEDPSNEMAGGPFRLRAARRWFSFWPLWLVFSMLCWLVGVLVAWGIQNALDFFNWANRPMAIDWALILLALVFAGAGGFVGSWLMLSGVEVWLYSAGVEVRSWRRRVWLPWSAFADHRGEPAFDRSDASMVVLPVGRQALRFGLIHHGTTVSTVSGPDRFPVFFQHGLGIRLFDGCEIPGLELARLLMALGVLLDKERPIRVATGTAPEWVVESLNYSPGKGA